MSLLGGAFVLAGTLAIPRRGVWSVTLEVDTDAVALGANTLAVERTGGAAPDVLTGTVIASQEYGGRFQVRMLGGVAQLTRKILQPRQWVGSPTVQLSTLIADLARETGEAFAVAPSVAVPRWARALGVGSQDLTALARAVGYDWRMLLDGSVVLVQETWPAATGDFEVHDLDEVAGVLHVVPDGIALLPGVAIDALRVERVVYDLGDGRAQAFYSRAP